MSSIGFPELLQAVTGCCGSLGFSLLFNVRGWKLIPAALGGLLSWGVCVLLIPLFPPEPIRYIFATMVLTFYAEFMARRCRCPATVFLTSGFIPLIPGGSLYYTLNFAMRQDWPAFFHKAIATLLLMIAMAAGILIAMTILHIFFSLTHREKQPANPDA